ncbi:MAG TPA: GAF domain-containing sensor histidine kinase [Anaerolineales bacterium]|jgi:signal transduction histidine kinase|nr:GAF domain-containing sensor histidine kinase [Anaerolineales bacterium]
MEHPESLRQRDEELAVLRRDNRRLTTLLHLVEAMSAELDLTTLLEKMVVSAVDLLHAKQGAIGLVDEERSAIRHRALHNLPEALLDIDFAEGVGISGQVYALKRPVIVDNYGEQVNLPVDDSDMRQIRAAVSVPIWWQDRLNGVFSIGTDDPTRAFGAQDVAALELFAKHAAIAIENARLYEHAERLAQIDERNRLARELHDSVTQSLFTIVLMTDAIRNYLQGGEDAAPTAELLYQTARDTLTEMRALIYELRPAALEGEGLITALRKLGQAIQTRHQLEVKVRQYGIQRLTQEQEEALFRVAQEALHNVVKHARARRAEIELHLSAKEIRLVVKDNGIGMEPRPTHRSRKRQTRSGGMGFSIMRERLAGLGGDFRVRADASIGLQIDACVPLS